MEARHRPERYSPRTVDIFVLGITLVLSGQFFSWNVGLRAGLVSYLIVVAIMSAAYVAFCCCVAEVTSALPFAGGSYGLARCTLGFFPAFVIGCCEALEYIASVAVIVIGISSMVTRMAPDLSGYDPLLWLLFYVPSVVIQITGGSVFWITNLVLGGVSLSLLLVYCFGMLRLIDLTGIAHLDDAQLFVGGFTEAMHAFPIAAWLFLGVEAMNLASRDVETPKTTIPTAQVSCIVVLVITGILTILTTVSIPTTGGIPAIATALVPLSNGFMQLFKIHAAGATALSLPSQYAAAFGLSWASTKLLSSMASSKLLPSALCLKSKRFRTPHVAIVIAAVMGYAVCLVVYFVPSTADYVLPTCLLFAFTSYSGQCIGYIALKRHSPLLKQGKFKSPFGIAGAVFSLMVWIVGIVALVGFQSHHGVEVAIFGGLLCVLGAYYRCVARERQTMSKEESSVLLVAHMLRFNSLKQRMSTTSSVPSIVLRNPREERHTSQVR
ncbi:hypothetical protein PINS_up020710 [Pythium insidiosum]|nr:hypothetical protein PINS_up020710 [Pythium insidiosum]